MFNNIKRSNTILLSQICNPVNTFLRTLCLAKIYLHIFLCFENEKLSPSASAAVVSSISRVQTSLMKFQNPDHQSEAMPIFYSDCDWQAAHSLERIQFEVQRTCAQPLSTYGPISLFGSCFCHPSEYDGTMHLDRPRPKACSVLSNAHNGHGSAQQTQPLNTMHLN